MSWHLLCKLPCPETDSDGNAILNDNMVKGSDDIIEKYVMVNGDIDSESVEVDSEVLPRLIVDYAVITPPRAASTHQPPSHYYLSNHLYLELAVKSI